MNRQEAIERLKEWIAIDALNPAGIISKSTRAEKLQEIIDALSPQPDPETGLLPCGCGPERIGWFSWNRAMGWREGNEN